MKLTKQKNKILEMMGLPKSTIKDKFKSHNRKQIDESLHKVKHFYGFIGLPNYWVDDNDKSYSEEYFNDKEYEDKIFDNFFDMDKEFGHKNSLFGTRGLEPGNPNRTSKSFNTYVERFGPMVVRVLKKENIKESIKRILKESVKEKLEILLNEKGLVETLNILRIDINKLTNMMGTTPLQMLKDFFIDKQFSIKDFDNNTGGYDFHFVIKDIDDEGIDNTWVVDVEILDGTFAVDDEEHDLWDSDLWQEDWWWEIQGEIDDIISYILNPYKPEDIDLEIMHNLR